MALLDNLTHYWNFNEASGDAADSVGGSTLTDVNTVARITSPFGTGLGNAADFESGNSERFIVTDPTGVSGANLTFNFWFKPETLATDMTLLCKRITGSNNRSFRLLTDGTDSSKLAIQICSDGTSGNELTSLSATGLLVNGEGHMYTIVFDGSAAAGSRIGLYKDGTPFTIDTNSAPTTCFDGTAGLTVGANTTDNVSWSLFTDGVIDELAIWNRSLSGSEIGTGAGTLYNSGKGFPYPFASTTGRFFSFMDRR